MNNKTTRTACSSIELSAFFDALMYLMPNYDINFNCFSVDNIISKIASIEKNANTNLELFTLALQWNKDHGNNFSSMVLSNTSWNMNGYNSGTCAAVFTAPDGSIPVTYRGIRDGEWPSNAVPYES